jgi:hypothetical protein
MPRAFQTKVGLAHQPENGILSLMENAKPVGANEWIALVSDLYIAILLLVCVAA